MRVWVEGMAERLGYSIVPTWRVGRWPAARHLARLFDWLHIDVVLDVGANRGQYRDFLRHEVRFKGQIISWEPIPELVSLLRQRLVGDSRWQVESAALGAHAERRTLHVTADTEFSSLHMPNVEARARFDRKTHFREVEIEVRTLSDELDRLAAQIEGRRLFLKLDTQGNDLEVLSGTGAHIGRVEALQSELAVRPLYDGVADLPRALSAVRALGFEPSAVFPNNDGHFPWLLEVDMHFVARRHLPAARHIEHL
jgi:FkbM family methyltransferase